MEDNKAEDGRHSLTKKAEISEAVLRDVAARLRQIGDEINEECTKKALPVVIAHAWLGADKLLTFLRAIKI